MIIHGDQHNSNKFYVLNDKIGLLWVPSLKLAKSYVSDSSCIDWFNHDIYCTSEDIILGYDGRNYLKSQLPQEPYKEYKDNIEEFKAHAFDYVKRKLEDYAKREGFYSFVDLISWNTSQIEKMKSISEKAILYRDTLTKYTIDFIDSITEIEDDTYKKYLTNFPKSD